MNEKSELTLNQEQNNRKPSIYDPAYYDFFDEIAKSRCSISWESERGLLKEKYPEWQGVDDKKNLSSNKLSYRVGVLLKSSLHTSCSAMALLTKFI